MGCTVESSGKLKKTPLPGRTPALLHRHPLGVGLDISVFKVPWGFRQTANIGTTGSLRHLLYSLCSKRGRPRRSLLTPDCPILCF